MRMASAVLPSTASVAYILPVGGGDDAPPEPKLAFHPLRESVPPTFKAPRPRKPAVTDNGLTSMDANVMANERKGFQTLRSSSRDGLYAPGWDVHRKVIVLPPQSPRQSPRRPAAADRSRSSLPTLPRPPRDMLRSLPRQFSRHLDNIQHLDSIHSTRGPLPVGPRLVDWEPPQRMVKQHALQHAQLRVAMDPALASIAAFHSAARRGKHHGRQLVSAASLPALRPSLAYFEYVQKPVMPIEVPDVAARYVLEARYQQGLRSHVLSDIDGEAQRSNGEAMHIARKVFSHKPAVPPIGLDDAEPTPSGPPPTPPQSSPPQHKSPQSSSNSPTPWASSPIAVRSPLPVDDKSPDHGTASRKKQMLSPSSARNTKSSPVGPALAFRRSPPSEQISRRGELSGQRSVSPVPSNVTRNFDSYPGVDAYDVITFADQLIAPASSPRFVAFTAGHSDLASGSEVPMTMPVIRSHEMIACFTTESVFSAPAELMPPSSAEEPSALLTKPLQKRQGSMWALKRGSRGTTMQERLLAEARKLQMKSKHGPRVSLSSVTQSLLRNKRVVRALRAHPAFTGLNHLQLSMLALAGHPMRLKRYGVLYRSDASSCAFYILVSGSMKVTGDLQPTQSMVASRKDHENHPAVVFGLEGLARGVKRLGTASALGPCELVAFTTTGMTLDEQNVESLARNVFVSTVKIALQHTPVFLDLAPKQLAAVATLFEFHTFGHGDVIIHEGEDCDRLYVLLSGSVEVSKGHTRLAFLQPTDGDADESLHPFFGSMRIREDEENNHAHHDPHHAQHTHHDHRATYNITSDTPSSVIFLKHASIKRLFNTIPGLQHMLMEYSDLRTKTWELDSGLDLSHSSHSASLPASVRNVQVTTATTLPLALELEAAIVLQARMRGALVRQR